MSRATLAHYKRKHKGRTGWKKPDYAAFPLKKLIPAVQYRAEGDASPGSEFRVRIGFLGKRAKELAAKHAEGFTIPVTERMRRKFFAAGLMLFASSIKVPKREHVGAVHRRHHDRIAEFARRRINEALAGRDPKSIAPPF